MTIEIAVGLIYKRWLFITKATAVNETLEEFCRGQKSSGSEPEQWGMPTFWR